ncbi:MAG: glycoside-pentoside-hexuronide (GPH):cation symporter, partial [Treponema sp.]|nr:glycoside-pentoside-hexuronide (GPH):cation symporter [Treponema sp.]
MAEKYDVKKNFRTGFGARFSYGGYFLGQNIYYMLLISYMTVFFTDVGIPAITVAAIALVVKIWDAVNDPIFGGIVDRVRFKKGKFLPWVKVSLVVIPLSTIFLFTIPPDISLTMKVMWAALGYILWDTAYTICDVPIFGLVTTVTDNIYERTSYIAIGRVLGIFAAILVSMLIGGVRQAIGGWLPTVVILSSAALVFMIPVCFTAKEKYAPPADENKVGLKDMFRFIIKNKYLLIIYSSLIIAMGLNTGSGLTMYFTRYNLGNEAFIMTMTLLQITPMMLSSALIPFITRRIDKFYVLFWSLLASGVLGIIAYFIGYTNQALFFGFLILRNIVYSGTVAVMYLFTPDCAEYGRYQTGIAAPGISFSIQTFSAKLISALSTSLGALALSLIGFVEMEGAVQTEGFPQRLWIVFTLIPSFVYFLALPVLSR